MEVDFKDRAAIVVVAFNRLASVKRLISSILNADYGGDAIDLIISIDNSGNDAVVNFAKSISWLHGNFRVIHRDSRLGLKKHVLACGDFTLEYKFICVLEDDLFVSPNFYSFSKQAVNWFSGFNEVAGISLYGYQWNQYADRPFEPVEDGCDAYFIQIASSWGQVWTEKWWSGFIQWICDKDDAYIKTDLLPDAVSNWSERSWLKFHNRYLVDLNKYFVYPRVSLTTNFSDVGEHASFETATYQVPLQMRSGKPFYFPDVFDKSVKYDSFFEYIGFDNILMIDDKLLDVDLYGLKNHRKRYLLSTDVLNYKIVDSFSISLRPLELNVICGIRGDGIFLYDTNFNQKNPSSKINSRLRILFFYFKSRAKKDYFFMSAHLYFMAFLRKLGFLSFLKR